jgi:hypothetical protein
MQLETRQSRQASILPSSRFVFIRGSNPIHVREEIRAELPDGAAEETIRNVTENCRTLGFESFEFEEE